MLWVDPFTDQKSPQPKPTAELACPRLPCISDGAINADRSTDQSSENAYRGTKEANQGTQSATDKTNDLCCTHMLPFVFMFCVRLMA